jgi:hypothetical protein
MAAALGAEEYGFGPAAGTPEMLVGYLKLIANEVRQILARLGLKRLDELVGRVDLLRQRTDVKSSLSLDALLVSEPAVVGRVLLDPAQGGSKVQDPPYAEVLSTISAEHPLMLILSTLKRLVNFHNDVVVGKWRVGNHVESRVFELSGKTLGIVGLGNIGKKVARRAMAFGERGR